MIDLRNVKMVFPPNSAYEVLLELVLNCGIDSVMSALGEIISKQRTGLGTYSLEELHLEVCKRRYVLDEDDGR